MYCDTKCIQIKIFRLRSTVSKFGESRVIGYSWGKVVFFPWIKGYKKSPPLLCGWKIEQNIQKSVTQQVITFLVTMRVSRREAVSGLSYKGFVHCIGDIAPADEPVTVGGSTANQSRGALGGSQFSYIFLFIFILKIIQPKNYIKSKEFGPVYDS